MSAERVCLIGSGNWGSAIAKIVGANARKYDTFEDEVRMWVFEEMVDGRKLTDIINTEHMNVKYLPGIALPTNVVAIPDLAAAVRDATILVFVLPHQFLPRLLPTIKENMHPHAKGISLIKGMEFDDKGPVLISDMLRRGLGIDVSVLMGANVANEVAQDQFCETTIGYTVRENGETLQQLFHTDTFHVAIVEDIAGVELCGALKNIVALGAGFCDGLGYGGNTKAAIIRIGLLEMMRFCKTFYSGVKESTFFESCGVADLITTCFGGRNRRVAAAFVQTGRPWDELEAEMLGGQMLQGTLTSKEVHEVLVRRDLTEAFPLLTTIYRIAFESLPPHNITKFAGI